MWSPAPRRSEVARLRWRQVVSAFSTQDRRAAAGAAPTWREITFPSRITSSVGMDCTPKRCCSLGESSTLTFTSFRRPARSVATCASAGLTIRHGPHQGAHRSTTTGTDARSATSAKVFSPASTTQGSALWQLPQLGIPEAAAGTRFLRPQFGHRIISSEILTPASTRRILVRHGDLAVRQTDADDGAVADIAGHQGASDPGLDLAADEPAQRAGTVDRVEALLRDVPAGLLAELEGHLPVGEPGPQIVEHQVNDALDLGGGQRLEQHDLVQAVQELGPECRTQRGHDARAGVRLELPSR